MENENKKVDRAPWNEYRIFAGAVDLFNAWRALRGSENVNFDITIFCDMLQAKLIDIYGRGEDLNG